MAQSPLPASPEAAPDLTGLRGAYVSHYSRALVVSLAFLSLLWLSLGLMDLAGGGDRVERTAYLIAAVGFVLMLAAICRPSKVVLDDSGIRLRPNLRWRSLAWADVVEVCPDYVSRYMRAYLISGGSVQLLGLPVEVGTQLQAALAARQLPRR